MAWSGGRAPLSDSTAGPLVGIPWVKLWHRIEDVCEVGAEGSSIDSTADIRLGGPSDSTTSQASKDSFEGVDGARSLPLKDKNLRERKFSPFTVDANDVVDIVSLSDVVLKKGRDERDE